MAERGSRLSTWDALSWLAGPVVAVAILLSKSAGAPLGEPVADDFDFLAARLRGDTGFFGGAGSSSFWRPIPHHLYYAVFGDTMVEYTWQTPIVHGLLLLATGWLLGDALRLRIGARAGTAAAAFLLLSEPFRAIVSWPSHAVELCYLLAGSLLIWCLAHRRYQLVPAVLLIGLLCKESMLAIAPMALLWPDKAWSVRDRVRVGLVSLACIAAWAIAYAWAAQASQIRPPGSIVTSPLELLASMPTRLFWLVPKVLSVTLGAEGLATPIREIVYATYAALGVIAVALVSRSRKYTADFGLWWWGLTTAAVAVLGLTVTYPVWGPYRGIVPSMFCAIGIFGRLAPAHRNLVTTLVALKCVTLLAAAAPVQTVGLMPPASSGAFDFQRLTRLQLLCRDVRSELTRHLPTLAHEAIVAHRNFPHGAIYAFGGSNALHAWTRDTSLRWVGYHSATWNERNEAVAVVDYEGDTFPSVAIVPTRAVLLQVQGDSLMQANRPDDALAVFTEALASVGDLRVRSFRSSCNYRRAVIFARRGEFRSAMAAAANAVYGVTAGADARFLLALLLADAGDRRRAELQLDTLLSHAPGDSRAVELMGRLRQMR